MHHAGENNPLNTFFSKFIVEKINNTIEQIEIIWIKPIAEAVLSVNHIQIGQQARIYLLVNLIRATSELFSGELAIKKGMNVIIRTFFSQGQYDIGYFFGC
jgi:hypothetical protein